MTRRPEWWHAVIVGLSAGGSALLMADNARVAVFVGAAVIGLSRAAGWAIKRNDGRQRREETVKQALSALVQEAHQIRNDTHGINNHLAVLVGDVELTLEDLRNHL